MSAPMKRLHIVKRISEGQLLPPFYGVAWVVWYSNEAICLPVPLNLIAALAREAWLFCKHGWRPMHRSPRAAYDQGRIDGAAKANPNRPHCSWCNWPEGRA